MKKYYPVLSFFIFAIFILLWARWEPQLPEVECISNARANADAEFEIFGASINGGLNRLLDTLDASGNGFTSIKACESPGSGDNLVYLDEGTVDFALVPNDLVYDRFYGGRNKNVFESVRFWFASKIWGMPDFRPVIPLFRNYMQVIVRDSGPISFGQLKGMSIVMGGRDSAADINARDILGEYFIERDNDIDDEDEKKARKATGEIEKYVNPVYEVTGGDSIGIGTALDILRYCDGSSCVFEKDPDECNRETEICRNNVPDECIEYAERCQIDAVITGSWRSQSELGNLRSLDVPQDVLTSLAENYPYYFMLPPPLDEAEVGRQTGDLLPLTLNQVEQLTLDESANLVNLNSDNSYYLVQLEDKVAPVLSTTTYLMTHTGVKDSEVSTLVQYIYENWSEIEALRNDAFDLNTALISRPIPFHSAASDYLTSKHLIFPSMVSYWLFAGFSLFLVFMSFAWRLHRRDYDRLGVASADFSHRLEAIQHWFSDVFRDRLKLFLKDGSLRIFIVRFLWGALYAAAVIFFSFSVALLFLLWREESYASANAVPNEFLTKDFWESMIWIFTWMATGFESNLYPISRAGRIWSALIGIAGVAAPLWLLYRLVTDWQARLESRARGLSREKIRNLKKHVLICGWNDRVPGLIFSLTGRDAPSKKRIVVVAEIEKDFPLAEYGFNPLYVHYCRGDSADSKTLEAAEVKEAEMAIIVSDQGKIKLQNTGGALTALAINSMNDKIHLVGEFIDESSIKRITNQNSKITIVNPPVLAEKLIAIGCNNPNIIDFFLDMVTYDDFDETNSMKVFAIRNTLGLDPDKKLTINDLYFLLQEYGVNLLAYRSSGQMPADSDENSGSNNNWTYFLSEQERKTIVNDDAELVLTCNDVRYLDRKPGGISPLLKLSDNTIFSSDQGRHKSTSDLKVIVIGEEKRAKRIQQLLGIDSENIHIIDTPELSANKTEDEATLIEIEKYFQDTEVSPDCAVFLNSASGLSGIENEASHQGDAELVLRCQAAKNASKGKNPELKIVAEICHLKNQALLDKVGVNTIVPLDIILQRFLAKPVLDEGGTTKLLLELISLKNDVHLRSIRLEKGDELISETLGLSDVLGTFYKDGRVIACAPDKKNHPEVNWSLINEDGDFHTHFITSQGKRASELFLKEGDVIVTIYNKLRH